MDKKLESIMRCIARGDISGARVHMKNYLSTRNSDKDKEFAEAILKEMKETPVFGTLLSKEDRGMLIIEDPKETFHIERYLEREVEMEVAWRIVRLLKTSSKLHSLGIKYPCTVLMGGPSGTGKTEFARYVANGLGRKLVYVNFSNCIDSHYGGTQRRLSKLFEAARNEEDCVFMLDELDAIGLKRNSARNDVAESDRVVVSLLQEMDRIPPGMVVMAATNIPDGIDTALKNRFKIHCQTTELSPREVRAFVIKMADALEIKLNTKNLEDYATKRRVAGEVYSDFVEALVIKDYESSEFNLLPVSGKKD